MTCDETPTDPFMPIRPRRPAADRALTVAAAAGVACILATVAAVLFGVRPMIFETGSMSPAIPVGALGFSRTVPATQLRSGDVATVVRADGTRVTHRVVSVDATSSTSAMLTMRGDANPAPDPDRYIVADARRVYFTVPVLGYVASWLGNPYTLAIQALGVSALLLVAFAPEQGWRRSRAARRMVGTTAAAVTVAVVATGVVDPGEARAATANATATGALATGRPANPTSLSCYNTTTTYLLLPYSTVELRWPNPPSQANYTYELSFPGQTQAPILLPASSLANPAVYKFEQGILGSLLTWILGGGSYPVVLTNLIGNFRSSGTATQSLRATTPVFEVPAGIRCVSPTGTASARLAPTTTSSAASSAPPSTSASSTSASSTSDAASSPPASSPSAPAAPTTTSEVAPSPTPELPAGGTPTSSGRYAFYDDGGAVTIRDATSTEVVYRGSFPSSSTVRWLPGSEQLEITEPDGTVVTVSRSGSDWLEQRTPPPTTAAAQSPAAQSPATQQGTTTSTEPVPEAPAG
ncbi:hypothetical protein [Gordonia neofelifaecis]|uniref:Peptidase S26B, signal peptidase n=1 Tax=Gordonia neofelifaecis NRRL B-59395 TaxID=644548 RepID=F1YEU8_9ACTN|nr:hypothetical protein [Gordonia neofelifaecis]EGD56931.1 hypothetical protein SCNU_01095 [Gordonia neofelifaecis NRRL B-59395]